MPLVPTIINFLHDNYEPITPKQLDNKTTTFKSMTYDWSKPINIIFNSFDDLVKYARAKEAELTQNQTINLALVILHIQQIFKDNIQSWKRTNLEYKPWDNLKHDSRKAHLELRETGRTIDKMDFHNANAIVDQMMARLQIDED